MLMHEIGTVQAVKILLLDLAFIMICCIMFYVCSAICRNVFAYQLLGTVSLTVFGAMGFINAFRGITGDAAFSATPVAVYIDLFIKAII